MLKVISFNYLNFPQKDLIIFDVVKSLRHFCTVAEIILPRLSLNKRENIGISEESYKFPWRITELTCSRDHSKEHDLILNFPKMYEFIN